MGSWEYVREIFDDVVDAPGDERAAMLEMCCGQDTELRDAVERLLVAADCEDFLIDGNLVGDFLGNAAGAAELDRPLIQKHAFDEGQTLAERFRVVRYIGRGGMGEVYEAYDPDLGRSVALKTVRSEYVGDALSLRRFMREIRMALAVTHPNVCRIYDVHRHLGEDGNEVLFLSMELLNGETLAQFIKRRGKISTDEAQPIVVQMCGALTAIHEKGIVHRDFTPKNVMLDGDRVVVTDFGLARPKIQESGVHPMTVTGQVLGVPDYLAPEQLAGAEVTEKADVYALGVIAYEMVTGRKPFPGDTPLEVAHAKAIGSFEDPAKYAVDLPRAWQAVLVGGLQIHPHQRITAIQFSDSFAVGARSSLAPIAHSDANHRAVAASARPLYALVIVIVVVLLALSLSVFRVKSVGGTLPEEHPPKHVVVLPVVIHGGGPEKQALADGLMESLTTSISQYAGVNEGLLVVPASEVRRQQVTTAADARTLFGVDFAIETSLIESDSRLRMGVSLVDATKSVQVDSAFEERVDRDLLALSDGVTTKIATMLDLRVKPRHAPHQPPAVPGAHEFYLSARGYLQRNDSDANVQTAIDLFKRAVELDSNYAEAYAGIAEANLYRFRSTRDKTYLETALQNARWANDRNSRLANARIVLGLTYNEFGQFEEAIKLFEELLREYPREARAHEGLADALWKTNRRGEAEASLQKAVQMQPGDWSVYKRLGLFYSRHGQYEKAVKQYEHVVALTPDNAQAYANLGGFHYYLGDFEAAERDWLKGLELDPKRTSLLSNLAKLRFDEGLFDEAAKRYEEIVELDPSSYRAWGNLAASYRKSASGDYLAAFREAARITGTQLEVNQRNPQLYSYLAHYQAYSGDRDAARVSANKALELGGQDPDLLVRVAETVEYLGESERAVSLINRALAEGYSPLMLSRSPQLGHLQEDITSVSQESETQ